MEYGRHFLFPSALFAEKNPHRITTVLGSCVAVCLYDPLTRQGGINHFMLPFWNGSGLASPRYGNIAIEALIDRMHLMGCQTMTLQAKIFGGPNVLYSINPASGIRNSSSEAGFE